MGGRVALGHGDARQEWPAGSKDATHNNDTDPYSRERVSPRNSVAADNGLALGSQRQS